MVHDALDRDDDDSDPEDGLPVGATDSSSEFHHVVTESEADERLDALLARLVPQYSRVRLRQLITAGEVTVDQRRRKPAFLVQAGNLIVVQFAAVSTTASPPAEPTPLEVLYEDECLVVINKPTGMVVHPAKGHWQGTLTAALAYRFAQLSQLGGSTRPGIVHRLDRDTSGVIVVARDDSTHMELARQFEQRTVEKEYFAICRGQFDRDRDRIEYPIGPHPYQREKMAIRSEHPASRPASTFYEVEERFLGFASVRVFPKTGRTHQIRVHLAHTGCPVLCDPLYSGQRQLTLGELRGRVPEPPVVLSRLALHAYRLAFNHPRRQERMTFEAPRPAELTELLARLRHERPHKSG